MNARAIKRCGELLSAIEAASNQHVAAKRAGVGGDTCRSEAARDAGMSKRQQVTAIRVARVPDEEFEAAVESPKPPTVTQLAERGKKAAPRSRSQAPR